MKKIVMLLVFVLSFTIGKAQLIEFKKLDTARVYTSLQEAMKNPAYVYRLDLTRERLREVPSEIYLFTNLNELILDRNKLKVLPDSLNTLRNLQILSAERNKLDTINPAICNLPNLRVLKLGDNYIGGIPDEISNLRQLRVLSLWSNVIAYYPISLAKLKNLERLDLLANQMTESEQRRVLSLVGPSVRVDMSQPCDCTFEDAEN
ncbi:leucine-rich repeat domain-containing protein [Halocola ammonii]